LKKIKNLKKYATFFKFSKKTCKRKKIEMFKINKNMLPNQTKQNKNKLKLKLKLIKLIKLIKQLQLYNDRTNS
jgi:hypothetical protein